MSPFISSLDSTTTLLTLDFYKPIFGRNKSDRHIARVGHIAIVIIGVIVVALTPVISLFPSGFHVVAQQFSGVYSIPMLALILVTFSPKRTSKLGAKVTLFIHVILYAIISFVSTETNHLYTLSVLFFVDLIIILIFNRVKPSSGFDSSTHQPKVDMTPWRCRYAAGIIALTLVVVSYIILSPLVLAK